MAANAKSATEYFIVRLREVITEAEVEGGARRRKKTVAFVINRSSDGMQRERV